MRFTSIRREPVPGAWRVVGQRNRTPLIADYLDLHWTFSGRPAEWESRRRSPPWHKGAPTMPMFHVEPEPTNRTLFHVEPEPTNRTLSHGEGEPRRPGLCFTWNRSRPPDHPRVTRNRDPGRRPASRAASLAIDLTWERAEGRRFTLPQSEMASEGHYRCFTWIGRKTRSLYRRLDGTAPAVSTNVSRPTPGPRA